MKSTEILELLEAAAAALGVRVRYDALSIGGGCGSGGLCRVRGEWWVLVDRKAETAERVAILTDALAELEVDLARIPGRARDLVAARRAARAPAAEAAPAA